MKISLCVFLVLIALPLFSTQVEFEHIPNRVANKEFKFRNIPSPRSDDAAANSKLTLVDGVLDGGSGDLRALTDGLLPQNEDEPGANLYFAAGSMGGRLQMDFGQPIEIERVTTYSWHPNSRGPQLYRLYAAQGTEPNLNLEPKRPIEPAGVGWHYIATVSTIPQQGEDGGQYAVSVSDSSGSLGKFRYLLFDCYVTELNDDWGNTFYSEIDVIERK